jgi:hypothetical protein
MWLDWLSFNSLKDVLDVTMLPIALALVAPWIAKRWQDRQRESETKTKLVSDISELVMTTVMTVNLFNSGHLRQRDKNGDPEHELDLIYRKWRIETCVIGSKLHAYFSDTDKGDSQLHIKWDCFSSRLSKYYEDARVAGGKHSADQREEEKEELFEKKARIIEEILASKITGFQPWWLTWVKGRLTWVKGRVKRVFSKASVICLAVSFPQL